METIAKHRFARIAPRKARLVVDMVRGLQAERALEILSYTTKKAAPMIKKVLVSALANAKHNCGLDSNNLWIRKAFVDEGSKLKRALSRAKGRGDYIFKRTSHITLVVSDIKGS